MHKFDAANGFMILSDPDIVKIMKMLCVKGKMSLNDLKSISDCENFLDKIKLLEQNNFIICNDLIEANIKFVDELLSFIKTPCGCTTK